MAIITNDFLPTLTIKNTAQLISIELRSPSNIIVLPKYVGKDYIQYSITECGQYTVIANTPWTQNLTYKFDFIEPYNKIIKYVPWDTDTTLLLHGNLTDVSGNNRVPNYSTNVVAKTDQQKINETSIWKPTGTRLSYDGCLLNDKGDYTVEFWAYCTTANSTMFVYNCGNSDLGILFLHGTGGVCYSSTTGSSWNCFSNTACGHLGNQWAHWCFEKYQNIQTVYRNGTIALTNGTGGTMYAYPGCETIFGSYRSGTSYSQDWGGYYDEIRLSKVARYKNAAFVPPTKKFTVEDRFQEVFEAPTTNLISSYSFDRKLTEDYSNKDDRDYNPMVAAGGSAVWYQGRHEKENCLQLNGSSYFRTSYQSLIPKCHPFSISMWFKVNNTNNDIGANYGSVVPLLSTLNAKNVSGIQVILNIRGQVEFQIIDNDATTSVAKSEEFYNDMRWHNLIVTYTGDKSTNGMKVYVDGVLQGQGTSSTYIIGEQEYLYMANRIATQTSLNGFIQELNIYDKVLNPQEIFQINGRELGYIEITGLTKRKYNVDEVNLDLTGLEVTAVYTDGFTDKITSQCEISVNDMEDGLLTSYSNELTSTYNYKGKIYTATMPISVIGHYLCLECVTPGTITLNYTGTPTATRTVQYSKDKSSWTTFTITTTASSAAVSMAANEKYYLRGTNATLNEFAGSLQVVTTGTYKLWGNINTLLNYTYRVDTIPDQCYMNLFQGAGITDMSNFEWPGKVIGDIAYDYLCSFCADLTKVPNKIPKANFIGGAYYCAFKGCTSLVDASNMVLPDVSLLDSGSGIYSQMFADCTSLKIPPQLTSTSIKTGDYEQMFSGCTSLKVSTTKSVGYGKQWRIPSIGEFTNTTTQTYMFQGCQGDVEATPTFTQATHQLYYVYSPDYLTFTANIPGSTISLGSGSWTNIETSFDKITWTPYIAGTKITLTNVNDRSYWRGINSGAINSTFTMTGSISASGNLNMLLNYTYDIVDLTGRTYCYNSLFYNCTALTTAPKLPATTLSEYCYQYMFRGCSNLNTCPELPAISLAGYCYQYMFENCTSIKVGSTLPATDLSQAWYCYYYMFHNCTSLIVPPNICATSQMYYSCGYMFYECTSLKYAPKLLSTTLYDYCYFCMFAGCTNLIFVPQLPATTLLSNCYVGMFANCTSLQVSDTQTEEASCEWTLPSSGVFDNSYTQSGMFYDCAGTRESYDFNPVAGSSKTYYTQNTPV